MDTSNLVSTQEAQEVFNILQNAGLQKVLTALGLLIILLIVSHFIVRLFKRFLNSSKYINKSLHTLLTYALRYLLILMSLMVAANSVGVPITTFVALFSIVGVAITLALQGVLSNIAGCLILVTGRQFEVGDYIETPSGSGTVKDISLLYTQLLTPNGTYLYIPNSSLYTAPVTNVTSYGKRRLTPVFSASYRHEPSEVKAVLTEALSQLPAILQDPPPSIVVDACQSSCVQYKIMCWTATGDYWPTLQKLNELVYAGYKAHNIAWLDANVTVVAKDG